MTQSNQTTITESIMTPITVDKVELDRLIESAMIRHSKTVRVYGCYSSEFINSFLEHLENGFSPQVRTATNLEGEIYMEKPTNVLEKEHLQLTLEVTEKYEKDIASKEERRKEALKKEQDRIRAERDKLAFEDKILNAKD